MTDERAALAARHQPLLVAADTYCAEDGRDWPCDTARALALPPDVDALAEVIHRVTLDEDDEGFDGECGWQFNGGRDEFAAAIVAAWPKP